MDHIDICEARSIHILRTAYRELKDLCMLWSMGKDSTVLVWLTRKAFFGHIPFPLVHIDTSFKIPEMITYRDTLAADMNFPLIVIKNEAALQQGNSYPHGTQDRLTCCKTLKTEAITSLLEGTGAQYRYDPLSKDYVPLKDLQRFTGIIVGARADEEGSRSKERYFSARGVENTWDIAGQPPEFWEQYNTDFRPGTHVRVHPLLDWTEADIWSYINRERIPTVSLYYDQGTGKRYRSLGCLPCTHPVDSTARTPQDIVAELRQGKFATVAERSGRSQDIDDGGGLETLRREGYM